MSARKPVLRVALIAFAAFFVTMVVVVAILLIVGTGYVNRSRVTSVASLNDRSQSTATCASAWFRTFMLN